ncbi:hypothetical protein PMAYCL1PPCAC_05040, partial [Pristionchus mayeri]
CVVCYRYESQREMHRFTSDQEKRTAWVNGVRTSESERRALMAQLEVHNLPMLCASHFSPSDYTHTAYSTVLRWDAVPSYVVPQKTYNLEMPILTREKTIEIKNEPMDEFAQSKQEDHTFETSTSQVAHSNGAVALIVRKTPIVIKGEPLEMEEPISDVFCPSTGTSRSNNSTSVSSASQKELVNCSLCDKTITEYTCTPRDSLDRSSYLRSIIADSSMEIARLAKLKKNTERAYFCIAHDMSSKECFLCDKYTLKYRQVPFGVKQRSAFFANIIVHTATVKARLNTLRRNNYRPFVCVSHLFQKARPSVCKYKCDLCEATTPPFSFTPKDPMLAERFYANLHGLNAKQAEIVAGYRQSGGRMTTCMRHVATFSHLRRLEVKDQSRVKRVNLMSSTAGIGFRAVREIKVPDQQSFPLFENAVKEEEVEEEEPGT